MMILCIDDLHLGSQIRTRLTKGGIYESEEYYIGYRVINDGDDGELETFHKDRFICVDVVRDIKLKKLFEEN